LRWRGLIAAAQGDSPQKNHIRFWSARVGRRVLRVYRPGLERSAAIGGESRRCYGKWCRRVSFARGCSGDRRMPSSVDAASVTAGSSAWGFSNNARGQAIRDDAKRSQASVRFVVGGHHVPGGRGGLKSFPPCPHAAVGGGDGVHLEAARIEGRGEAAYDATLPGGVPAFQHDGRCRDRPAEGVAGSPAWWRGCARSRRTRRRGSA
jgi:hypothetical protein